MLVWLGIVRSSTATKPPHFWNIWMALALLVFVFGLVLLGFLVLDRHVGAPSIQSVLPPPPTASQGLGVATPRVVTPSPVAPREITQPVTNDDFVDAHVTPDYLLGLRKGRTSMQADALTQPSMRKKMRVSVIVEDVGSGPEGWMWIMGKTETDTSVLMYFAEQHSVIAGVDVGDVVDVVGTLGQVKDPLVILDPSTLEKVG
jgi:hypothetical protein